MTGRPGTHADAARPPRETHPPRRPERHAAGCGSSARPPPDPASSSPTLGPTTRCYRRPPRHGRGKLILTGACPRTGSAWTSTGTPHELRCLKHRPDGAVRGVSVSAALADLLRQHLRKYGTAPDGRLFRGARGGILSESTYGRIWHAAREIALGPQLAATSLARRPYDLRHAALSLWLNATGAPAEAAAPRGQQRARAARRLSALHRRAERPHQPADRRRPRPGLRHPARITMRDSKRLYAPLAPAGRCPPYVHERPRAAPAWPTAFRPRIAFRPRRRLRRLPFPQLRRHLHPQCAATGTAQIWPTHGPQDTADGLRNRSLCTQEPVTQITSPALTCGNVWQVLGSNQRRLSRRFYSPLLLAPPHTL